MEDNHQLRGGHREGVWCRDVLEDVCVNGPQPNLLKKVFGVFALT